MGTHELAEKMEEEVLDTCKVETAKERLTKAELPRWNGGVCEDAGSTGYGEEIVGQESSPCSQNTTCSVGKARMKLPRKKNR